MIEQKCKNCGNVYLIYPSRKKRSIFCSNKCKWEDNRKRWIGNKDWEKTIATQFKKGHGATFLAWSKKFGRILYKKWLIEIMNRDNNECKKCKSKKQLVVHHKKSRADYPELLMDDKNVITLCRACHMNLHRPNLLRK